MQDTLIRGARLQAVSNLKRSNIFIAIFNNIYIYIFLLNILYYYYIFTKP